MHTGKTLRCTPSVELSKDWLIEIHWSNEDNMLRYIGNYLIIVPFVKEKKEELGSDENQLALIISRGSWLRE